MPFGHTYSTKGCTHSYLGCFDNWNCYHCNVSISTITSLSIFFKYHYYGLCYWLLFFRDVLRYRTVEARRGNTLPFFPRSSASPIAFIPTSVRLAHPKKATYIRLNAFGMPQFQATNPPTEAPNTKRRVGLQQRIR